MIHFKQEMRLQADNKKLIQTCQLSYYSKFKPDFCRSQVYFSRQQATGSNDNQGRSVTGYDKFGRGETQQTLIVGVNC